jgi:transcription termination/antitermination protein NusG
VLKESENPPMAWPADKTLSAFSGQWWVAHTKSRNEKALANELVRKNVSYFLPMRWKTSYSKGRKLRSLLPLFGGYLFFCGEERERIEVLKTNRVANCIEVKNQARLVSELSQIERAINAGVDLTPHDYIKVGQRCRVTGGPLAGLAGIVIKSSTAARLVLQVDMLGQAASVEIDTDLLETTEEAINSAGKNN